MTGRDGLGRGEAGIQFLPIFERLAPAPPADLIGSRIDALSHPGDVVVDLQGRGGWVARAAVQRQRRAFTFESTPLTRLLADVVLRPPDIRHLDAAFQAIAAAPRQESSLKVSISETFASRCGTCARSIVVDEYIWEGGGDESPAPGRLLRKQYRCPACRGQQGGGEHRTAAVDDTDLARAAAVEVPAQVRAELRERFPAPEGRDPLADELLDLHTPRQLSGLHAILRRIETDLRAAPVIAALRLGLLQAILPASRLNMYPGRTGGPRISGGRLKPPGSGQWRERNPWVAFEDGYRLVRGFVQELESTAPGSYPTRLGEDLLSLAEGASNTVVRVGSPASASLPIGPSGQPGSPEHTMLADVRRRMRLVLGQLPLSWPTDRLSLAYVTTSWVLGRDAAATLPLDALFGPPERPRWDWQAAALRRSLEAVAPLLARDARVVIVVEPGGPESAVAAALAGSGAGYRTSAVRLSDPDSDQSGWVELVPPGSPVPGGPRTRANQPLPPLTGGSSDAIPVPGRGLFAAPERIERGPFSMAEAARSVTETVVEILQARGEPASRGRLLGEVLVGLDRAGHLRRYAAGRVGPGGGLRLGSAPDGGSSTGAAGAGRAVGIPVGPGTRGPGGGLAGVARAASGASPSTQASEVVSVVQAPSDSVLAAEPVPASSAIPADAVTLLLELIDAELTRPDNRRIVEVEPGRWWLATAADEVGAAVPLTDRIEWAVFSLLATAGRITEPAFFARIASLFPGYDLPDETLVRACLESYRSVASTPEAILPHDDLVSRSQEHSELIALLAELGHHVGMKVWIAPREQTRRVRGRPLEDWLDDRELKGYLPMAGRAGADALDQIDCIWYVRSKATMYFEVEWTAMLGEMLRRHARIPTDDRTVRFLVVAPERVELLRHKLERSILFRRAMEAANWHILKWNHLRALAGRQEVDLGDLEPFLGLDPAVERGGDQMPLFGG